MNEQTLKKTADFNSRRFFKLNFSTFIFYEQDRSNSEETNF